MAARPPPPVLHDRGVQGESSTGSAPEVVVVGSANVDLLLTVPRIPAPGETVLATGRRHGPGGKGLNQAVAAARAGAATTFVGSVGADAEGRLVREVLRGESITPVLHETDRPTGLAVVAVDDAGENAIVVAAGANAALTALHGEGVEAVRGAAVLVAQLEVPLSLVQQAVAVATDAGAHVVLNAAPVTDLPDDLLRAVDVLVVNEGEARVLAGGPSTDPEALARRLAARARSVVLTLGGAGVLVEGPSGPVRVPALQVEVADTTAAGDTFTGYLAAGLAAGAPLHDAARRAAVAAALCVTRAGAVQSVPHAAEVSALLTR